MKTKIKYLIESFFDNNDELEKEKEYVPVRISEDKKDLLKYIDLYFGLDLKEFNRKKGKYGLGLLLEVFEKLTYDQLDDPNFVLEIKNVSYCNSETVSDFKYWKSFIQFLKSLSCKIKIITFDYHNQRNDCSVNEDIIFDDNVSIQFFDIIQMEIKSLEFIPQNITSQIIFSGCFIWNWKNYNITNPLAFTFNESALFFDWKDFPTTILNFLEISFNIGKYGGSELNYENLEKDLKYVELRFPHLKNFNPNITFIDDQGNEIDIFQKREGYYKGFYFMKYNWPKALKASLRQYIKELCKRDIANKADQQKTYKMMTKQL